MSSSQVRWESSSSLPAFGIVGEALGQAVYPALRQATHRGAACDLHNSQTDAYRRTNDIPEFGDQAEEKSYLLSSLVRSRITDPAPIISSRIFPPSKSTRRLSIAVMGRPGRRKEVMFDLTLEALSFESSSDGGRERMRE